MIWGLCEEMETKNQNKMWISLQSLEMCIYTEMLSFKCYSEHKTKSDSF